MKHFIKIIFVLLIVVLIASCDTKSTEDDKFSFSASITNLEKVEINKPFDVLVKTKNVSGSDIVYEGSSTVIGAIIYLKSENGEIIRPNDKPVTKDFRQITIKSEQEISTTWNFEYEVIKESGSYDLYFEFLESTCIIEDFIIIE